MLAVGCVNVTLFHQLLGKFFKFCVVTLFGQVITILYVCSFKATEGARCLCNDIGCDWVKYL